MYKILLFIAISYLAIGCGSRSSCEEFANRDFRPVAFRFIVEEKHMEDGRVIVVSGKNMQGKQESFRQSSYFTFYKIVEPGDTIAKKNGEMKIYVNRRDSAFIARYYCKGIALE